MLAIAKACFCALDSMIPHVESFVYQAKRDHRLEQETGDYARPPRDSGSAEVIRAGG
jgi:hypothetical protein